MSALRDGILGMLRTGSKTSKELGLLLDRKVASVKGQVWTLMNEGLVVKSGKKGKEVSYALTAEGVKLAPRPA